VWYGKSGVLNERLTPGEARRDWLPQYRSKDDHRPTLVDLFVRYCDEGRADAARQEREDAERQRRRAEEESRRKALELEQQRAAAERQAREQRQREQEQRREQQERELNRVRAQRRELEERKQALAEQYRGRSQQALREAAGHDEEAARALASGGDALNPTLQAELSRMRAATEARGQSAASRAIAQSQATSAQGGAVAGAVGSLIGLFGVIHQQNEDRDQREEEARLRQEEIVAERGERDEARRAHEAEQERLQREIDEQQRVEEELERRARLVAEMKNAVDAHPPSQELGFASAPPGLGAGRASNVPAGPRSALDFIGTTAQRDRDPWFLPPGPTAPAARPPGRGVGLEFLPIPAADAMQPR
jgi:hypothetical protein